MEERYSISWQCHQKKDRNKTRFKKYVENLSFQLLQNRYGLEVANEKMKQTLGNNEKMITPESKTFLHSSTKFYNRTDSPTMTPLGECCLARHLSNDYRLIKTMLGHNTESGDQAMEVTIVTTSLVNAHPVIQNACLWGDEAQQQSCRSDLSSMLTRRAKYLDQSRGSCSSARKS